MRIQIDQEEIETGIRSYIKDQGIDLSNVDVTIDLTAGRGDKGFTAVIALEATRNNKKVAAVEETIPDDTALTFSKDEEDPML